MTQQPKEIMTIAKLTRIAGGMVGAIDRRRLRCFVSIDEYGRFVSFLVLLPRDRYTTEVRLAMLEELKALPSGAVWDYHCLKQGVPVGLDWLAEVRAYERDVFSRRG